MRHSSRLVLSVLVVPFLMGASVTLDDAASSLPPSGTIVYPGGGVKQQLAPTVTLSPDQQEALRRYAQPSARQRPPANAGPGDQIPSCYMVYGYGTDAHGKGRYLDAFGNALPMNGDPRMVTVWRFHDSAGAQIPAMVAPAKP